MWVCCGQHKKLVETAAFKLIENNLNQTFLEKVRVEISPQTDSTKIKQEILQDFSKNFQFELLEHQNQQNTTKQRLIETKKQLADKQKDAIFSTPNAGPNGVGVVYVVYGNTNTQITQLLTNYNASFGCAILGPNPGALTGVNIYAADLNSDGYDDIVIGCANATVCNMPSLLNLALNQAQFMSPPLLELMIEINLELLLPHQEI